MPDLEALRLQIVGDAKSAEQSINSLIDTLGRLQNAVKGGSGLNSVANALQKINTAVNSLGGSGQKLQDLAKGLTAISGVGKVKIPPSVATKLTQLGTAVAPLGGSGQMLEDLARGLSALSTVGQVKISPSIATQLTAIDTAVKNSATTDYSSISRLATALQPLTTLGKSGLGTLISQLKNLPSVAAELDKVDMGAFTSKINALAAAMRPLANEMQKVANGFAYFPTKIQSFVSASARIPTVNAASALSFARLYTKLRLSIFIFMRLGRVIASWINTSNKYIEDMNLFAVTMGEYAESAKKYADDICIFTGNTTRMSVCV